MAATIDLTELENDPRLFLYTSLTAGSSHIITATSRLETILKANKIPFQAVDTATDEKCRRLWGRRAGKRKLPGLVKEGYVIGDLEEVEEWNEFGELKVNIGPVPAANATPAATQPKSPATSSSQQQEPASSQAQESANPPMRDTTAQAASIGLARAGKPPVLVDESKIKAISGPASGGAVTGATTSDNKEASKSEESTSVTSAPKVETMNSAPDEKKESLQAVAGAGEDVPGTASSKPTTQSSTSEESTAHRGSEVSEASGEEIKAVEEQTAIPEEATEEASTDVTAAESKPIAEKAEALEGQQSSAATGTQSQAAKEAESATVSVED